MTNLHPKEDQEQDQESVRGGKEHRATPSAEMETHARLSAALATEAERLIGDLEYGCGVKFTEYRGAALAIARAYLQRTVRGNGN